MKALDRLLMRLVQGFALVAACAMLVMMGQVTLDVLLRWLANHPIDGTLELVANYYMVALIFLPLGLLTYTRDHITVELFTRHMGERPLAVLDLLGNVVALIYVGVLIWMGTLEAWDMTLIGETWTAGVGEIVVWPARWLVPAGGLLMAALFLLHAVEDLIMLVTGQRSLEPVNPFSAWDQDDTVA